MGSRSARRQRQSECQGCRRRLALERHAHKRVGELIQIDGALAAGLVVVRKELDRWQNVANGSPRKGGEWRRKPREKGCLIAS